MKDRIKVYLKKGPKMLHEKKMVSELESVFNTMFEKDPSLKDKFTPATTFEDLKKLHNQYCSFETPFQELKDDDIDTDPQEKPSYSSLNPEDDHIPDYDPDPLNNADPRLRDYVLENKDTSSFTNSNFDEPKNDQDAFEIPEDRDSSKDATSKTSASSSSTNKTEKKKETVNPANPSFADMEKSDKTKSTKKLAEMIANVVAVLSEMGLNWYGSLDITDKKLEKFQEQYGIDLAGINVTVDMKEISLIEYIISIREGIAEASKFTVAEKKELAASIYPLLLDSGISLTPKQEAIINMVSIAFMKIVAVYQLKASMKSVLMQIVDSNKQQQASNEAFYQEQASVNKQRADEEMRKQDDLREMLKRNQEQPEKGVVVEAVQKIVENEDNSSEYTGISTNQSLSVIE